MKKLGSLFLVLLVVAIGVPVYAQHPTSSLICQPGNAVGDPRCPIPPPEPSEPGSQVPPFCRPGNPVGDPRCPTPRPEAPAPKKPERLRIFVDNHEATIDNFIVDGRVMVKLRQLVDALRAASGIPDHSGPHIYWLPTTNTVKVAGRNIRDDYPGDYEIYLRPLAADGRGDGLGSPSMTVYRTFGDSRGFHLWGKFRMPVAAQTKDGATYVPLRAIADAMGMKVTYDEKLNAVSVFPFEEPVPTDFDQVAFTPPIERDGLWSAPSWPTEGYPFLPSTLLEYEKEIRAANAVLGRNVDRRIKFQPIYPNPNRLLQWVDWQTGELVAEVSPSSIVRIMTEKEKTLFQYFLEDREAKNEAWRDLLLDASSYTKFDNAVQSAGKIEKLLSLYTMNLNAKTVDQCWHLAEVQQRTDEERKSGSAAKPLRVRFLFNARWSYQGCGYGPEPWHLYTGSDDYGIIH